MIKIGVVACAVTAALVLTSCGGSTPPVYPFGNDVAHTGVQNTTPADEVVMPDGYSPVMTKCDHGNRLYLTKGSPGQSFLVPRDATCMSGEGAP